MDIKEHHFDFNNEINIIIGQSHFIKTVDDLSEIVATTVPGAKFAVAFNEASGPALIRWEGNDDDLVKKAIDIQTKTACGHTFALLLKNCFPINIMSKVKMCDEVVRLYCATSNPVTIMTTGSQSGNGIIGVIDGSAPKGVETDSDKKVRREFLRKIGYKF